MNKWMVLALASLLLAAIGLSGCQPIMLPSEAVQAAPTVAADGSVGTILQVDFQI